MAREPKPATPPAQGRSVVAVRACVAVDEDGIQRGDVLLVHPEPAAPAGSTVVAVVDGRLSVRRLIRGARGERQLVPVSPQVLPLVLPAERAQILGPLVGVVRHRRGRDATQPSHPVAPEPPSDPELHMMGEAIDAATLRMASNRSLARLREITRDLRSLRDCYARTSVPKLRRALLREAQACVDALRRVLSPRRARSA